MGAVFPWTQLSQAITPFRKTKQWLRGYTQFRNHLIWNLTWPLRLPFEVKRKMSVGPKYPDDPRFFRVSLAYCKAVLGKNAMALLPHRQGPR